MGIQDKSREISELNHPFSSWMLFTQELIIILSPNYIILEFNPIAEKIFGIERAKALGQEFINLCKKSSLESPLSSESQAILEGKIIKQETAAQDQSKILSWTITRLLNENNIPNKIMLVAQDITHVRALESDLNKTKESIYGTNQELIKFTEAVTGHEVRENSLLEYAKNIYSYLEGIIAAVPGCVYWMNREGKYLGCNDEMARIYGLGSRKNIVGKTYEDIYNKKTGDGFREADIQVMTTGEPLTKEEMNYASDGFTQSHHLSHKVALRDKFGNIIGMLGNSLDITQLKQYEYALKEAKTRAEVANFAKSEFLAVISHEFRIPLTGILGMAKLVSMQDLPSEKQQEYVNNISSAGMYLLNLINDTLDFAKLEAGKYELVSAPIDLNVLIEETCTMLTPLSKAKNLELIIQYDQTIPQILGDKRALRQIIINVVGNAIKFTEKGTVSIQVECLEKKDNNAKLVFLISDTGIGIPEDKQGMIFDHFSQVDASHSRRHSGTGLGLTITKQLIDLMSGTIGVTSQEGKGTTFRCVIDFPFENNENSAFSPWMGYQSMVRILIVDDTSRGEVMRKHLGYSNSQVVSGVEAFNVLLASYQLCDPYKIVIIDQRLLRVDPLELAQSINKHPELRQSMLILLPDDGSIKTKEMATMSGFFDCIVKPIQPLALQIALTAAWEKWVEQLEIKKYPPVAISNTTPINTLPNPTKTKKLKILLVEDDAFVEIIHRNYLEKLVETIHVARNGQEALEKLKDNYDLIFMDMGLPDISGKDVLINYRKRKNKHRTPIISLTGYSSESNKQEFITAGANEVMIKPVFIEQLENVIQKYCH
jgi:PAS domain S-box-containing protein